jgi:hypothetical protein
VTLQKPDAALMRVFRFGEARRAAVDDAGHPVAQGILSRPEFERHDEGVRML